MKVKVSYLLNNGHAVSEFINAVSLDHCIAVVRDNLGSHGWRVIAQSLIHSGAISGVIFENAEPEVVETPVIPIDSLVKNRPGPEAPQLTDIPKTKEGEAA